MATAISDKAKEGIAKINKGEKVVYLFGFKINDDDAAAIAEALKGNTTLTELRLSDNEIGDAGAIALAESLVGNTSLKTLHLYKNKGITDTSVPALKKMLQTSIITDMYTYPFHGCSISAAAQPELKALIEIPVARRTASRDVTSKEKEEEAAKKKAEEEETARLKALEVEKKRAEEIALTKKRAEEEEAALAKQKEEEAARKKAEEEVARNKVEVETKKITLPPGTREIFENVLQSGESAPLNRGKLMMTGPGRAGKSATVRSLLGKPFNPNLESTIGADASQTCSVDRNENVVNWMEMEKENEFAGHVARAVAEKVLLGKGKPNEKRASIFGGFRRTPSKSNVTENTSTGTPSSSKNASSAATQQTAPTAITKQEPSQKPLVAPITTNKPAPSASTPAPSEVPQRRPSMLEMAASLVGGRSRATSKAEATMQQVEPIVTNLKDDQMAIGMYNEEIIGKTLNGEGNKIALSIWDLGGQDVFYALHHLFLTKYAVYLCIFDMRAMASEDEKVRASSINYTNFWLRSIQMHAPGAPVFLIGTFKDMVPNHKDHERIDERLHDKLDFKGIAPTIVLNRENKLSFWPIDNSKGGNDPMILRLREAILDRVAKMDHISLKVPLAWTLILDKLMATKKRSITMSEVLAISSQNNIADRAHITSMLALFHELGMILHFSKTDELRDLVVLDPQWLVDALTMVIRDFELHPYDDDLRADLRLEYATEFKSLKNESIVSVNLMNRLWKGEDENSEIDFTRRKFLISLMDDMTLSCAWRFGEDYSGSDDEMEMRNLPPPSQFLVPCNLRLFRPQEIETQIRTKIDKKIHIPNLDGSKSITPNCFVVDLSLSFLPIGFFDRLVCLLVAHSSLMFKDSRDPLFAKGAALLSFGVNDFRVDEDLSQSRIIVTMAEESDRLLILTTVESMVAKLKDEVMGALLKYRILVVVWRDGEEPSLIDIEKAREAVASNTAKIRDISKDLVATKLFISWVTGESSSGGETVNKISQNMPAGKSNHVFLAFSPSATSSETIKTLQQDLSGDYGVRFAPSITEIQKGIDSSICVVLVLADKTLESETVQTTLRYVNEVGITKKERIAVILVQEGGGDVSVMLDRAPSDIREMFSNFDKPLILKQKYSHEKVVFVRDLFGKIQDACSRTEIGGNSRSYIAFLSHFKKETGITARLMQEHIEKRCVERKDQNSKLFSEARAFLDSDNLSDLRLLLDDVRRSKTLVVLLSKGYFTRPWCLAELHVALESKIPIITVNVADGGYDRVENAKFLSNLTPEIVDRLGGPGSAEILSKLGIDISKLGARLAEAIPKIIEIPLNPLGSKNQIGGSIDDVIDRILSHYL